MIDVDCIEQLFMKWFPLEVPYQPMLSIHIDSGQVKVLLNIL